MEYLRNDNISLWINSGILHLGNWYSLKLFKGLPTYYIQYTGYINL